jgi:hypothetical protein
MNLQLAIVVGSIRKGAQDQPGDVAKISDAGNLSRCNQRQ